MQTCPCIREWNWEKSTYALKCNFIYLFMYFFIYLFMHLFIYLYVVLDHGFYFLRCNVITLNNLYFWRLWYSMLTFNLCEDLITISWNIVLSPTNYSTRHAHYIKHLYILIECILYKYIDGWFNQVSTFLSCVFCVCIKSSQICCPYKFLVAHFVYTIFRNQISKFYQFKWN